MFKKRIDKLRKAMDKYGIDGVLLVGDANRNYLSGFTGNESFSVITCDKAFFITDSRFTEQAVHQVKDYEVLEYGRGISFIEFLDNLLNKIGIKRIGFEENVISYSEYNLYTSKLQCEFVPMNGIIEKLRIVKDEFEIQSIQRAADIADKAFEHIVKFIKCGMTEREIGLELEFYMKKLGARELSFPSIVASGTRSSLPHGEATDKAVNKGEFLTLDFGCIFDEYCSDMTRTVVIGEPTQKMLKIYNTVFEAQQLALKEYKPGISAAYVDSAARDYIEREGYGKYFGHGLGHGVGRQIHEAPTISFKNKGKLEKGMVVTDEPGIYIPDFGGVRIEDLLVVTEEGGKVLSRSQKELICIG